MPIGEYGAREARLKQIAELKTELLSKEAFNVLKHELRKNDNASVGVILDKLHYAKKVMNAKNADEASRKVLLKITRLQLMAARGAVKDEETNEAISALAEYVLEHLGNREWSALALTLDEAHPGLRIAPDLVRLLLVSENPEAAVRKYKKEAEAAMDAAPFSFRASVVSSIEHGVARKGPEHIVPFVESEIDWGTGKIKAKYLFLMARYETDTKVNGPVINVANLALNPVPEYEPLGAKLKVEKLGRLRLVAALSRIHWIPYIVPVELIETTHSGKLKVTAMPDTNSVIYGHGFVFVTAHPESTYTTILELNPELHRWIHASQEAFLAIEMQQAPGWYKEGDRHDKMEIKMVLRKTPNMNEVLAKNLRLKNELMLAA